MTHMEKLSPRTFHISLKGQGLVQLTALAASYLPIRLSSLNRASCLISIIPNFLAGFMQKMYIHDQKKLFNVTSVNFGFILR